MIKTFLFLTLGKEKVCWNVAEKLEKYCEGVEEGNGDRMSVYKYFGKMINKHDSLPQYQH